MSERGGRPGPPKLRLGLVRKLKILALANIIPIIVVTVVGINVMTGDMEIRTDVPLHRIGFTVALLLVCCVVIGTSSWIVMPAVRWLRDYPTWHYHHVSSAVWLVPSLVGWVVWIGTWLAMLLCVITSIALMVVALWVLVGDATTPAEQTGPGKPPPPPPSPYRTGGP